MCAWIWWQLFRLCWFWAKIRSAKKWQGREEQTQIFLHFIFPFMEIWIFLIFKSIHYLSKVNLCGLCEDIPYIVSTELILYIISTYSYAQDHRIFEVGRALWAWSRLTNCSQLWCHIRLLSQSWNLKGWRPQFLGNLTAWLYLWWESFFLCSLWVSQVSSQVSLKSLQFMPNISHPPTNTLLGKAWLHLPNTLLVDTEGH